MSNSQLYPLNFYLINNAEDIVVLQIEKCLNLTIYPIVSEAETTKQLYREITIERQELSLSHKLKFSNPNIFAA